MISDAAGFAGLSFSAAYCEQMLDGIRANLQSFAEIRDGMSSTMMVVEVNDRAAVPWTKPVDFDPADAMKPTEKLEGVWPNVFLGAMGDGSVQAISIKVDPATLKAIFTKSGGEAIDHDALHGDARRRARPAVEAVEEVI